MNQKTTLIKLYHLLVSADGNVDEREIAAGRQMIKVEGIPEVDFNRILDSLKKRISGVVYSECLEELKKLSHDDQVRCIAWLCVIANADGFMDKTEWHFIYKLYHTELALQLDEIMKKQKNLIGLKEKSSLHAVL
ncbi:MAG TPA: TerB family tellurite resistance protein [Cyclobacteriaceae bacterium]|nr:TerB family tellurite resistance protein [Cyclobacteriaceae bacterium]